MWRQITLGLEAILVAQPATALCYYHGQFNVHTTIAEEFAESRWVVRARVLSATDCWGDTDGCRDPDAPFSIYWLKVVHSYKGNPPPSLKFFTERDSGGFYMDRPWVKLPAGHDIGGEYLLFLVPNTWSRAHRATRNSVFVNYSCGQSKPWTEVPTSARKLLDQLSKRNHRPRS
jgi:hypothetical protein